MLIGTIRFYLEIPSSFSLKDKRRILSSLKAKLKNKFNISVAEIGEKDMWNRGELAVAVVSDDSAFCNEQLGKIISFIEESNDVNILEIKQEVF